MSFLEVDLEKALCGRDEVSEDMLCGEVVEDSRLIRP